MISVIKYYLILTDDKAKAKKLGMEIGKDAAEKSKGLFSADDWMCTKYYFQTLTMMYKS